MFELYLLISLVVVFILTLAGTVRDVWTDYCAGRRSCATALAITFLIAGMPVVFAASALEQAGPADLVKVIQVVGIGLVFAGGIFGAVGLVLDRQLRKAGAVRRDSDVG